MIKVLIAFSLCFIGLVGGLFGLSSEFDVMFPEMTSLPLLIGSALIILVSLGMANVACLQLRGASSEQSHQARQRMGRNMWMVGAAVIVAIVGAYFTDRLQDWMWITGGALAGTLMLFSAHVANWSAGTSPEQTNQ